MSVRAYHLRRKAYRQTAKPVSNPGQPSPVNRKARRVKKQPEWRRGPKCQKCGHWLLATDVHHCPPVGCAPILDPDPPEAP